MFAFWRIVAKAALKVVEFCIRRMERTKKLKGEGNMEAENMSRSLEELALENRPKTYRITVEAIGPEVDLMNNGAPRIIETDGFFIIGISKMEHDDGVGMGFNIVAQHVTPMDIAKGVLISDHAKEIQEAMMLERMLRKFKEVGA